MCGRFNLRPNPHELAEAFATVRGLDIVEAMPARYNIAPTQQVLCVGNAGEREFFSAKWDYPVLGKGSEDRFDCMQ